MASPRTVHLRQARVADLPRVRDLVESAGLPTEKVEECIQSFAVAEEQGRVVGCGGIEIYAEAAVLRSFAVEPALRGAGIGAQMAERQLAAARSLGVHSIYLFTLGAASFWERMGFERVPLALWPAAARQCWQYQTVSAQPAAFNRLGVISMWRSLDASLALPSLKPSPRNNQTEATDGL